MDQMEYTIGGRSLKRIPVADLLTFRQRYASEVAAEDIKAKLAAGLGSGRKLQIRL
jgi:hypothetical protein